MGQLGKGTGMRKRLVITSISCALFALSPSAILAANSDVAAGQGSVSSTNPRGTLFARFVSGASDTTPGIGEDGNGTISLKFQSTDPLQPSFEVRAKVTCVNAVANRAVVVGDVTRTTRPELQTMIFYIEDNGPPVAGQPVDRFSATISAEVFPVELVCQNFTSVVPLESGNFTVKDRA